MEKAIEIKRRAQRCIQSGDLDGALSEYGKLTGSEDSDPYTFVLIADLQFKKGEPGDASQSYLAGVGAYEKAGLYKNAIAICKKMMRLSLSAPIVLQRLAQLHALDGLGTEASLYYMQYAEHLTREEQYRDAGATLRKSYEACSENLQTLERLAEVQLLAGDESDAVATLLEAAQRYQEAGDINAASRVIARAEHVRPGSAGSLASDAPPAPRAAASPELIEAPAAAEAPVPDGASAEVVPDIVPTPDELEQPVAIEKIQTASAAVDPADISSAGDWFTTAASDMGVSPSGPGLRFDATAEAAREGVPHRPAEDDGKLAAIEALLGEAEEHFRTGERESATAALVRAARAYDELQRYDSSAAIYRSLSRSAHVTTEVMSLWLKNCEAREDRTEASQVACALGERSLNDGDLVGARVWFEEALRYDPNNDLAKRRIQRMEPDAAAAAPEQPVAPESNGRVEVALGRAQAVTMELGSMIEEFQRGIEAQLSGDAQSHYDLGVTYREMGLLEQAADAFRVAAADPAYAGRCAEMIGRTLLDQGRFDEAVDEFVGALARPLDPDAQLNLRFHLGLALEAAGRAQEALTEFEAVYAAQANYPEVAAKIRGLRRTLENV